MTYAPGRFCWYELATTDVEAATKFYGTVVGWDFQVTDMTGMPYTMVLAKDSAVGGVMTLPEEVKAKGMGPHWIGYIAVDDVDAAAATVLEHGGKQHRAPDDIPHVGRFAVVGDPQGAPFVLFKPSQPTPPPALPMGTPGRIAWHELAAQDGQGAMAFYADMFGWEKGDPFDMGPMGVYQIFNVAGERTGGIFNKPPAMPYPFWLYYFQVSDINAAAERVKQAGGTVVRGPQDVPGDDVIIQAMDPQGAMFALVGKKA